MSTSSNKTISRRSFVKGATTLAVMSALPITVGAAGRVIKIGYISPQTGPLSSFSDSDDFIIEGFNNAVAGSADTYQVFIKDSQSNPNVAASVAKELILDDEVDLILVGHTPETVNPVAIQCEMEEVPCISTLSPWQPTFIGQQANPRAPETWEGLRYCYHFFWGIEDVINVFTDMWNDLDTNRTVAGLFPNDTDGNAWGNEQTGFPKPLASKGFSLVDPGRFQPLTDNFSAQISAFKQAQAEIVTGVVIPPDFATFWSQSKQQGFNPKVVSIGKAILFPSAVKALGAGAHNLSSEIWWSPEHPYSSSLTNQSSSVLANAYEASSNRAWTQPIGFVHALFELAVDVMSRTGKPSNSDDVVSSIKETNLNTIVGNVNWNGEGVPDFAKQNVTKTKLVGGQWRVGESGASSLDLKITNNKRANEIATQDVTRPIDWS
ncbi:ABC transporter substrate-binding protein [Alteromonas sp. P256]|uniref:ABC transporter substrate-binding protein n=1 Tax=Alteromonas sp. P256 TaxID=3117399 RepID=UPI002FE3E5F6